MSAIVRAIDVGFGNTKFVTASSNGKVDCKHFPSLAFYSYTDTTGDAIGGKRRTVCVPVDSLFYEVGPDVELAAGRFRARQLHDGYTETEEYRAFMAGALHYMKVDAVDLLVVGLPVGQYLTKRAALEKAMTGTFHVGKKRTVAVKRTLVVAQPQGALISYAAQSGSTGGAQGKCLVIDVGSRTFDWLVTRGMRVIPKMSDSVNRGVSDILLAIAAAIGAQIREDYRDLEAIDAALQSGNGLTIYQKAYDLKRFDHLIQKIADEAVSSVLQRLDATHDVENIVLVGGGAYLFKKAVKRRFPKHSILEVQEPLYANVRGFQLLGEQYVRERPELLVQSEGMAASAAAAHEVS